MRRLAPLLLLAAAACYERGHAASIDAAPGTNDGSDAPLVDAAIDAPAIDMAIDAQTDAPMPPTAHHRYVLDSLLVPLNNTQARDYGLDLDNDGVVDNQLGMVMGTLTAQGFDLQASTTAQVDRGQLLELFDLGAASYTSEPNATFAAYAGASPMPAPCAGANDATCRRHLTGSGTFAIAAASPINPALTGSIVAGSMTTAPGHLLAPITLFTVAGAPLYVTLVGAKVQVSMASDARIVQLKLTGGITQADIDGTLIPAMREGIEAEVRRDCTMLANPPTCGCPSGSTGKTMLDLFDTAPKNCTVSVQEVRDNSLIQSLLAPDVTLEGQRCLSYGVRATAVAAAFVGP